MSEALFAALALLAVIGALTLVAAPRPWPALLGLLGVSLAVGAILVGLGAVFLAAVQILVSSGLVVALWLFVVQLGEAPAGGPSSGRHPLTKTFVGVSAAAGLAAAAFVLRPVAEGAHGAEAGRSVPDEFGGVERVGAMLFGEFPVALGVLGVLLLAAWVGSLLLVQRNEP